MICSRPNRSRTTSCTLPLPLTVGMLVIENGPGGTVFCATSALLTKTSTVEGSAACPLLATDGNVTKPGWVAKLVEYWTPPNRTARPHAPGTLTASPRRSVDSRSGKSVVQVVSSLTTLRVSPLSCARRPAISTPYGLNTPASHWPAYDDSADARDAKNV